MNEIVKLFEKAGWSNDVAVVLAECFEHDHPAVRIREEKEKEKPSADADGFPRVRV